MSLKVTDGIRRIRPAVVFLKTLSFKSTGAEESRYVFSAIGREPEDSIGSALAEFAAFPLILIRRTTL